MKEFYTQFFAVNTKDYPNLGWDLRINVVLISVLPIALLCCIAVHLFRKNIFYVVKQLTRHNAVDEESACTLSSLGLRDNVIVRFMLSGDGLLTRLCKRVGAPEYTYEEYRRLVKEKKLKKEKINFDTAKFYLNEAEELRIKKVLERYDLPLSRTILVLVFVFVIFVLVMLMMPEILTVIDSLISTVNGMF